MTDTEGKQFVLYRHFGPGGWEYRWRLKTSGGGSLAWSSGGYMAKAECEREIRRVCEGYPGSTVRDLTLFG